MNIDKRLEWCAMTLLFCMVGFVVCLVGVFAVETMKHAGMTAAQGVGLLLMAAALALLAGCWRLAVWAGGKLRARRLWRRIDRRTRQNEKRPPIGPTAEEVARNEMAKRLAGWPQSGRR